MNCGPVGMAAMSSRLPTSAPYSCRIVSTPCRIADEEFIYAFKSNIKDTVEDELSDVCIRLLDLAGSLDISLEDIYDFMKEPEYKDWDDALKEMSFTERMFFLTSILTNDGDIAEVIKASIVIIFLNADLLYIDLLWHIEQKMKYNELRENKHGKRY